MLDLEPFNKWKMILKIQLFLAIFENIWFIPSRTLNKQKQQNLPEFSTIEKDLRKTSEVNKREEIWIGNWPRRIP